MVQHFGIALLLILSFFLGKYMDNQAERPYIQYKKRRDSFLRKIKKGEVLRGTSHYGEEVIISRFGIKKINPKKQSTA